MHVRRYAGAGRPIQATRSAIGAPRSLWSVAGPGPAPGAHVVSREAPGAVAAGLRRPAAARKDVAVADARAVDVGGVDDYTRVGGTRGPHRRADARAADHEPPL